MTMEHNDTHGAAKPLPRPVYAITEREGQRSIWTRIGAAWNNRDGSITVRLDALPVNGVLQVRDPDERDAARAGGAR